MSYEIVWTYEVGQAQRDAFERAYGPDGDWARLFARAEGFLEVVLLADAEVPGRYLTIDRWRDETSFDRFMAEHGEDYAALDDALAGVSGRGTRLGGFVRG
ncbi:antibiotic biosynthesis monooxygenase family protein [Agromyces bauzanensis]